MSCLVPPSAMPHPSFSTDNPSFLTSSLLQPPDLQVLYRGSSTHLLPSALPVGVSSLSPHLSLLLQMENFPDFLAVGIVILISIAIAAGVVFLLVLLGILWTLFSRKEQQIKTVDQDEDDDSMHQRPSSLLAHVNAATRTTIIGATSPFSQYSPEKEEEATGQRSGHDNTDVFGADASNYVRAETPSDALGSSGEVGRPAHARYSFEATGDGELALSAGMELEVLDDSDQAYVLLFRLTQQRS